MLLLVAATFTKFVLAFNTSIMYEYIYIFRVEVTEAKTFVFFHFQISNKRLRNGHDNKVIKPLICDLL